MCIYVLLGSDRDVPLINPSLLYNVASWPVTNINSAAAFTHAPYVHFFTASKFTYFSFG